MPISKLKAGSLGQSSVTSDNIVDGTIVNADISPSAAIASAKVPGIATLNTSISENNPQFKMYPNPVCNYLFITSFDNSLFEKYIIFYMQGKKIKSGIFNSESIYTGDLNQGMYMIKYHQEIKKFVKK